MADSLEPTPISEIPLTAFHRIQSSSSARLHDLRNLLKVLDVKHYVHAVAPY